FEFIIVDSGSTDGTAEAIRAAAARDRRIQTVFYGERRTRAFCANAGIALARAPFVARMDADDIAEPSRFEHQMTRLAAGDLDVCGSHAQEFGLRTGRITFPSTHDGIVAELCFRISLFNPTVIM